MSRIRDQAFAVIDRIGRLQSEPEIGVELKSAGQAFDYQNFFMIGLPSPSEGVREHIMLDGWPEEWLSRYAENGYVHVDPVIRKSATARCPSCGARRPIMRTIAQRPKS